MQLNITLFDIFVRLITTRNGHLHFGLHSAIFYKHRNQYIGKTNFKE